MSDCSQQNAENDPAGAGLPSQWQDWQQTPDGPSPGESSDFATPADRAFLDYEPEPRAEVPPVWEFPACDDGRAAFFLQHFGNMVRYVPELKQWRIWHGQRWHADITGRVGRYCQILSRHQALAADELLLKLSSDLANQVKSSSAGQRPAETTTEILNSKAVEKRYRAALRQAESLGNEKTIEALLDAAARDGKTVIPLAQWDADPFLVGVRNGTLNLRTGTRRDGEPGDYITRTLAVTFDPAARAPEWDRFIKRILPNEEVRVYVQRLLGYSITGNTDDQAFYFLYGTGKNGKSIFIAALAALMGDYAGKARRNLIEEPRSGADCKHDLALIPGVRFLYGEETSADGKLREDVVKALTGGTDALTGEAKYCDPFHFIPCAKLWVMGNHKPRIDGTDYGIWRRVRLIPFETLISDEEEIPSSVLLARFEEERAGILNWMLEGLAKCGSGPLAIPPTIKAMVAEYRESEDVLGDFLAECTRDAEVNYKESKHAVYKAYQDWAEQSGIKRPWASKQFTRRLGERPGWRLCPSRTHWMGKSLRRPE